jgi:integrase
VPDLRSAAPKAERPNRSYLEAHEIAAVLRAATLIEDEHRGLTWEKVRHIRASSASAVALARELGVSDTLIRRVRRRELWVHAPEPRNRNDVPRRAIVEALILLGPRVSELCRWDVGHLDLANGRAHIPFVKTAASERIVPMLPAVRERLLGHRLDYPGAATEPAFPTRTGRRQHPDNVRARILAPIRERANELLAAEGRLPIRHLTPHTLRRTFASILAVCNVPPRRAMYLLGHADPTLTLAVYQQVLDMRSAAVAELEETIGATLTEAHEILCGRGAEDRVLVMNP